MKAFTWKRIVLCQDGDRLQVAKEDLQGIDPKWKNKNIIWKEIDENRNILFEDIQTLFKDKTKTAKPKVIEKVIAVEQARKFLPPEKEMNLSIVMARWPTPEDLVDGVQELSQKDVTVDNL